MDMYYLTKEEDEELQSCILLPGRECCLYEYFCQLPLEDLKVYPEKGYHDKMGLEARSAKALEMRDYILFWRLAAQKIRKQYSRAYLKTLSQDKLDQLQSAFLRQIPLWAYEGPLHDIIQLLTRPTYQ